MFLQFTKHVALMIISRLKATCHGDACKAVWLIERKYQATINRELGTVVSPKGQDYNSVALRELAMTRRMRSTNTLACGFCMVVVLPIIPKLSSISLNSKLNFLPLSKMTEDVCIG